MEAPLPTRNTEPQNQTGNFRISELTSPEEVSTHQPQLCNIVQDCANKGSSIGFLAPLSDEDANSYWDSVKVLIDKNTLHLFILTSSLPHPSTKTTAPPILGTVQLVVIPKITHLHRAEVLKLLVSPDARRQGIARKLMEFIEEYARGTGRQLLTLDTATESVAMEMYRKLGWEEWGTRGGYASWTDGRRCDATFF